MNTENVAESCTTLEEARDLIRRREKATLEILILAAPIMEAWAKSHELEEWHCRVEDLIGTAYPIHESLERKGMQ